MTDLDQFYTKPQAASQCYTALTTLLGELIPAESGKLVFVEPSSSSHADLRLHKQPPLKHPDFVFWQYDNTSDVLKVFNNDLDFAIPCQG